MEKLLNEVGIRCISCLEQGLRESPGLGKGFTQVNGNLDLCLLAEWRRA